MASAARDFVVNILGDSSNVDKVFDAFGDHASKIAIGAAAAFAGAGIGEALNRGMDISAGQAKLAASLNLTTKQSATAGKAAGDLFAGNYGDSMEDVQDALAAAESSIEGLKDANASTVTDITSKLINLRTAFGVDVGESSAAAGELMKNGLAKNGTEAVDLLTSGFQKVPQALRGDLLDAVNEYQPYLKSIGLSGSQMISYFASAAKEGSVQLDKSGDVLKELGIKVTDLTDSTAGPALKRLGLNQHQLANDFQAGGSRARDALTLISGKLQEIDDPAQRATTAVQLFGTPLEDIGKAKIPAFLDGLNKAVTSQDKVAGSAAKLDQTLNDTNKNTITTVQRGFENWVNQLVAVPGPLGMIGSGLVALGPQGIVALGAVAGLAGGALEMGKALFIAADGAQASRAALVAQGIAGVAAKAAALVGAAATGVATAAQWAWNAALSANPIGIVIVVIAALVAALVWFFTQTKVGQEIWSGFMSWLQAAWKNTVAIATAVWGALSGFFSSLWNGIAGFFRQYGGIILAVVAPVIGLPLLLMTHWNEISGFFRTLWSGVVSYITGVVNGFVSWFRNTWSTLVAAFTTLWRANILVFQGIVSTGLGIVRGTIDGFASFFRGAWSGLTSFFVSSWRNATGTVRDIAGDIVGFFRGLPGRVSAAVSGLWNGLTNGFRAAVNWIVDRWNGLHFTIPKVSFAGITFGGGSFGVPAIPHLATGGVTNGPTYALIGDNPGGREVVQPLASLQSQLEAERSMAWAMASSSAGRSRDRASVYIETYNEGSASPYEVAHELDWMSRVPT